MLAWQIKHSKSYELHKKKDLTTVVAISVLSDATIQHHGELEFLVSSHENASAPRLVKVADGRVIEGADFY